MSSETLTSAGKSLSEKVSTAAFWGRAYFQKHWAMNRAPEFVHRPFLEKIEVCLKDWTPKGRPHLPHGVRLITCLDEDYPEELLETDPPPLAIFTKGEWRPDAIRMAVVGSRKPTAYSLRITRACMKSWVEAGFEVVSGGAFGLDAEAHRAALDFGGRTLVVMGSGFQHLYPKAHRLLFQEILDRGGVWISEYPPNTEPHARFFPERNRIIAALGHSLFLAQAHLKSGSMITAKKALELGREIFVLRPPSEDANFEGSRQLLESGAIPVSDPQDWMLFYHPDKPRPHELI